MLTDTDSAMLEFAGQWWKHEGLREQAVRERFGVSLTRYEQRLNVLIDNPEAVMNFPTIVNRLRRSRGRRRSQYRAS